jgi:hypothetical protein
MVVRSAAVKLRRSTSALGQKRTLKRLHPMSALPPKADIAGRLLDVRYVPEADMILKW